MTYQPVSLNGAKLFPGGIPVPAERSSGKGRVFPAEWHKYDDPITGRRVTRFTSSPATDQHPYFTGPATTTDGRTIVIISDRTGHPNLFAIDAETGTIGQLTDNRRGTLRQYVFTWGNRVGFGKSSVAMNARTGNIYYVQGCQVRRVNAYTGDEVTIAEIPPGYVTAFTHVSSDDALLCIPLAPESAFVHGEDGFDDVRIRIKADGTKSLLWVVATDGSSERVWAEQCSWITHVQFRPNDNRLILFNNEAIHDLPGEQRMWMCDADGRVWKIRPEPVDARCFICHEVWTASGDEILYHGHEDTTGKRPFFGFSDILGTHYHEIFLPDGTQGYGHFGVHPDKDHAYCDGYLGMDTITLLSPGTNGVAEHVPICRHGSLWLGQDDHPHPILSGGGKSLIFSSSSEGTGNVYAVDVQ